MIPQRNDDRAQPLSANSYNHNLTDAVDLEDNRLTQARVRLRISKDYHQDPIISRLISDHGIIVNITAALLSANACDDGWFDLELRGRTQRIRSALVYLNELDLELWYDIDSQNDGW